MNNKILASTGAYLGRINNFDHSLIGKLAPKIHCDGYELMIYKMPYEHHESYERAIIESKVKFETVHLDKLLGDFLSRNEPGDKALVLTRLEQNIILAKKLGVRKGVLHLWGGMPSDQHIEANFEFFPRMLELAKSYDFMLMVENIPCNKSYNPFSHWGKLAMLFPNEIKFTLDTRFIEFHGLWEDFYSANWLWKNDYIEHIHISDYSGDVNEWERLHSALPIGQGQIDFKRFLNFLREKNYEKAITIECSARVGDKIDLDLYNSCIKFVREN